MTEENICPVCNNDIYKPFTYCNSCGWEKSDEDEKVIEKPKKKGKKKEGKKAKPKPSKEKTVPCPKCGEKVPIESDKRPITIECPNCGTKGTLKDKPEKKKKVEKKKGKKKEDLKVKEPKKEKKKGYKKVIPCPGCGEDIFITTKKRPLKIECENCGKTGTIKK